MPKEDIEAEIRVEAEAFNNLLRTVVIPSVPESEETVVTTIALELMRKTMKCWPVDTGRSRAGWRPIFTSLGVPPPPPKGKSAVAQTEGEAVSSYRGKRGGGGFSAELVNGVDYSIYLEAGSSGQQPTGCLRNSMQAIRQEVGRGKRTREFIKSLKGVA